MRMFNRLLRQRVASDKNPPVNTTAGESTSLLTQTAGALFGLMPALMSKAANAASAQHTPLDGNPSLTSGHAAPSVGGTGLAHSPSVGVSPNAAHDAPAAALDHAHAPDAPPAQVQGHQSGADQSGAIYQTHDLHGARGSEAPQPLHLPDTSHDSPQPQGPSMGDPAAALHETAALPQTVAGHDATGSLAYPDDFALHLRNADVGQDLPDASRGALDVSGAIGHALAETPSHAAALANEVGASVGSLAHETDALLTNVATTPLDTVDRVASPALSALDLPILHAGVSQAADHIDGAVQDVLSAAGHLSDVGLLGTSALGSASDPVDSLAHGSSALLTGADNALPGLQSAASAGVGDGVHSLSQAADALLPSVTPAAGGSHTPSISSETGNLSSLAHDAIAPLTSTAHAPSPSGSGSEPTSLLGSAGGNSGAVEHNVSSDLASATNSAGTTLDHAAATSQSVADASSALHASAVPPQANATTSSPASLSQSVSDIGHVTSQTSDGMPLHVPLVGQSFADQDVGHDAGFSLHVLHGI